MVCPGPAMVRVSVSVERVDARLNVTGSPDG
jgi:hypothetical protein